MSTQNITFIGGGNMARSLIGGLISDAFPPQNITVADPDQNTLNDLQQRFGIHTASDNLSALHNAEVVVLAVKPQLLHSVIKQLKTQLQQQQPLLVSIAAGVREQSITQWLG
ncbi:MAG: NAD(P)-binding domain-containing protein, partial [Gammaproteobacteria bacterium]|nr:NAD(P)-binding domain-containing protein [Gammaproteobacteria bacterium]